MSIFSGKCDIYDHYIMLGDFKTIEEIDDFIFKSKFNIYEGNVRKELEINNLRDLVPYYAHIISAGCFSKYGDNVTLSSESYIDLHEKEILEYELWRITNVIKKLKKSNNSFSKEKILDELHFPIYKETYISQILDLIFDKGSDITTDDILLANIHYPFSERSRKFLCNEMINYGYTLIEAYNWCYHENIKDISEATRYYK